MKQALQIVPRENCTISLRQTRLGSNFILHDNFICARNKDEPISGKCRPVRI